jgi:NADPH:quinone reductase-like Zn-dependent oxidoreductase
MMKTIVHTRYGSPDVLEFREVDLPSPRENEVLVKVHAASVNAMDWHMLSADIFLVRLMGGGVFKPSNILLGADIAGTVEAAGREVTGFPPGTAVFGGKGSGGFAEYVCVPAKVLALKPSNLTFEQAAAVPVAGLTALQGLRDQGRIEAGKTVLIQGASGGVGTFAVQIAKAYGAQVTAVCSPANLEQARRLGADRVIDYTTTDFTQEAQRYDLIFAANGYHPVAAYRRALTPGGIYVMAGGTLRQIVQSMFAGSKAARKDGKITTSVMAQLDRKDLDVLKEMLEAGKIVPAIDRTFAFAETIEAMRYFSRGHARGKVVIQME